MVMTIICAMKMTNDNEMADDPIIVWRYESRNNDMYVKW